MNSINLISKISTKLNLNKKSCELIFNKIIEGIKANIKENKEFDIENFGNFKVVRRKMQKMIDYNKKAVVLLPPKDKLIFNYYDGVEQKDSESSKKDIKAKELIKEIAAEYNINEIDVYNYYYTLFDVIKSCFKKNTNVNILEFGKFKISGKGKISFSPAKKFHDDINYNFNNLETVIIRTLTPAELVSITKEEKEKILKDTSEKTEIQLKEKPEVETTVEELEQEEITEEKEEIIEELLEKEKAIIKAEVEEVSKKLEEEKQKLREEIAELKKRIKSLEILDRETKKTLEIDLTTPKLEETLPVQDFADVEKEIQEEERRQAQELAEIEREMQEEEVRQAQELAEIEREIQEEEKRQMQELEETEKEISKETATTEETARLEIDKKLLEKEESWEESFERKWRELREKIFSTTPSNIEDLKLSPLVEESAEKTSDILEEALPLIKEEQKEETQTFYTQPEEQVIESKEKFPDAIKYEETITEVEKAPDTISKKPLDFEEEDISPAYPEVYEDEDTLSISEIYGRLKESFSYISSEQKYKKDEEKLFFEQLEKEHSQEKPYKTEIEVDKHLIEEQESVIKEEPTEIVDTSMEDVIRKYERLREKLKEELAKEETSYSDEIISEKQVTPLDTVTEEIKDIKVNDVKPDSFISKPELKFSEFGVDKETDETLAKPISSIEDLDEKKVKDDLSESIDKTLQEIKSYMDEIARKEKLPLSNGENNVEKETPFKVLNDIELPKSIDDYFEQITRDNIKKFPDINGNNNEENKEKDNKEEE